MVKIATILISFGMGFEYENYGSEGEKIISFNLGLEVVSQNGYIFFNCMDVDLKVPNDEDGMQKVVVMVEEACINETT